MEENRSEQRDPEGSRDTGRDAGEERREGNALDFRITWRTLIKYALPTLFSQLLMNIYTIVDSLFISNLLGTDALSALNIVWPIILIVMAIATMVAIGGSALCAKLTGEGREHESRRLFTTFTILGVLISAVLCIAGFLFRKPVIYLFGADDSLWPYCNSYASVMFFMLPFVMTAMIYQTFFVTAGHPNLGFLLAVAGGVVNIVLDYVFIGPCGMGMAGAALASGIGYILQAAAGTVYFACARKGLLFFTKPKWDGRSILRALSNGVSEMVVTVTSSVSMILMNVILMKISGSDSVAACAIIMSVATIIMSVYMGYVYGVAPLISYHYGMGDERGLKKIFRAQRNTLFFIAILCFALCFALAEPVARIYVSGKGTVYEMAVEGTFAYSPTFLVMGFNVMTSSLFTSLNDGKTSAFVSFMRTFVFVVIPLLVLPRFLGVWGVWIATPIAECLGLLLDVVVLKRKDKKYHYLYKKGERAGND